MVSKGIRFFSSGINLFLTTGSLPQPIYGNPNVL